MIRNKKTAFVIAVILLSQLASPEKITAQEEEPILVGAEYFNGWWAESPNKWERRGKDWRIQYPERIPLLGEYNSQETMDKEIEAASMYGIDFFSILWYYPGQLGDAAPRENHVLLNAGIDHFMRSPNAGKMKFMVELCNHSPFSIVTNEDWDKCMAVCFEAMKHPSYLRIDGRAVLKIHSFHQFNADNDSSIERSREILRRIRQKALDADVGELLIMIGVYGAQPIADKHRLVKIEGIDGTMQYMDPTDLPQKEENYLYETLAERAASVRRSRANDAIPYVPYFPAGWNPKPWNDPRAAFSLPNRSQWTAALTELKTDLLESANYGFPKKDGTTRKAFTIYAWNEYGEGGFIAPTRGDQYMKLEVIKEIFGE